MLYRLIAVLIMSAFFSINSYSQKVCGLDEVNAGLISQFPEMKSELDRFELERPEMETSIAGSRSAVIIPVVVHVIHNGQNVGSGSNISESKIVSQLEILNDDFNRMNADASNTPQAFQGVAASTGIQFCLATIDPSGNATTGILRYQYQTIPSTDFIENTIKPATSWDSNKYLNIWTVEIPSASIIGYSYLPTITMVGSIRDGLVVEFSKFGYVNSSNRGRTATHEIGHYLGLQHIWGLNDNNGNPLGCGSDDGVNDTPNQEEPYYSCPGSGFSCSSNDMYMNFMDYTDDYCMNIFTAGQASVMNSILSGIRSELISNNLTACSSECIDLENADYNFGFEPGQPTSTWSVVNNNGDDRTWIITDQSSDDWGPNEGTGMAVYLWNPDAVTAADDYLFTPCLDLKAFHDYRISFSISAAEDQSQFYPEKLEIGFSADQSASDFFTLGNEWVFDPVNTIYPQYQDESLLFTTENDLTISIGFHVYSNADQYAMQLDDISIEDLGSTSSTDLTPISPEFEVFPNPTNGLTTVKFDVSDWEGSSVFQVFNSLGQKLREFENISADGELSIDLSSVPQGLYFFHISNGNRKALKKVIKH